MKIWLSIAVFIITLPVLVHGQADPPFGMSHIAAYSVFTDAVRNDDHEMALQFGLWMLEAKPRQIEGITTFRLDRQFERLIGVYIAIAEEEPDPSEKRRNLEEAERIYDLAFETFTEDEINLFRWYHQRGRFYHEHHNSMNATLDDAFYWYEKAYQYDRDAFIKAGDGFFVKILLSHHINTGERDKAVSMIDEIEEIASQELLREIDQFREQLFDSPEERIAFMESRLDGTEGEERILLLLGLAELYEQTGARDKAIQTARDLYDLNPDFDNTRRLADIYLDDGNYRSAVPYLKELVELAASGEPRGRVLLELSETYQQTGNLREARMYARRALDAGGVRGEALMRISLIYASAVSQCTGGRSLARDDRTVYWLVLDYLERALEADPGLRSTIQSRMETYRTAMPSSEDKFFRGWETGESFRIGGNIGECYAWIDETTTVR